MQFECAHSPRPHANALVRPHQRFTLEQRLTEAIRAGWNVFQFPSKMLQGGDLLSDSGTTTLTLEQFAASILGDEAYGSNWGYPQLVETLKETFGLEGAWKYYIFHQGRAAEHALYSQLRGRGTLVLSNGFFDTTRANAEANGFLAVDLCDTSVQAFKGNIDCARLEENLKKQSADVPFVLITITNNTGGGQPVSMANLRAAQKVADTYQTPLLLDACRFAENAWFIKHYEEGYEQHSISSIVHEMFSLCDGFVISLKKDGLANMGGALVLRTDSIFTRSHPDLLENIYDHQVLTEGHPTYGGLTGGTIMTIVEGLKYVTTDQYLDGRIGLVRDFGTYLTSLGVPILEPIGGHAVYIDIDRFFAGTRMRREDFGGISLTALLLLKGVRLCELGAFAFGKYDSSTGRETFPPHNYVRAAVPRQKYELQDLYHVAECIQTLYDRRDELPKAIPTWGRDKTLRHFKARFALEW